MTRIYLDNAATSWPKPEAVYQAVDRYQRLGGAAAGRGGYAEALEAQEAVDRTRRSIARMFGVSSPQHVVFTLNGTDALNQAIHGSLFEGGHVITSVLEHNSVLRPLRALEESGHVRVTRVRVDGRGMVDPADFRSGWQRDTRLVVLTHASNVTGIIQPAAQIGALARERDALFLLDAAQTAGEIDLDVSALSVDMLASPGHKGLLGPLGTGVLYIRPEIAARVRPVRQGGTGTSSDEDRQPASFPERQESGNLNVAGIVGLGAGVQYLLEQGTSQVARRVGQLTNRLAAGLAGVDGVRLVGTLESAARVAIVSIVVDGYDPQEFSLALEASHRVQTRAGLHCAPLAHRALGTFKGGGTVRFSLGPFTTPDDIDRAMEAVTAIAAARLSF